MADVLQLWETLNQAIVAYTGLSPAAFFTILAVAVAFYYGVSGFFQRPPQPQWRERETEQLEPLPPPVKLGQITEEELKAYDGSDPKKPLLMAIKGQIYDVSRSRKFYGPGGPYALFTGRDASRALAKMSFEEKDLTGDISGLGAFELHALQDWEEMFASKYAEVGTVLRTVPVTDGFASSTCDERETDAEASPADGSDDRIANPPETNASANPAAEDKEVEVD